MCGSLVTSICHEGEKVEIKSCRLAGIVVKSTVLDIIVVQPRVKQNTGLQLQQALLMPQVPQSDRLCHLFIYLFIQQACEG